MPATTIVVPCYNEADRLEIERYKQFAWANDFVKFVMVNDGSHDETAAILSQLQDDLPGRFEFLDLPQNMGKAEAVRQGIVHAHKSDPDYVGFWDADLATPLEAIGEFADVLNRREDIDIVIGSRLPLLGRQINRKRVRKFLGRVFSRVASIPLGISICDTQCGAKLFRVTPTTKQIFQARFIARWIFDVELLARLIQLNRNSHDQGIAQLVFEYPLDRWDEIPGSKLKAQDFLTAAMELWSIYWKYLGPFADRAPSVSANPEPAFETSERRAA